MLMHFILTMCYIMKVHVFASMHTMFRRIYASIFKHLNWSRLYSDARKIEQSYTEKSEKGKAKRALVARLRQSPSYQYELEVIAKDEAAVVVGHVMLSKINIVAQDAKYPALELASLSVDPEVRAQGIGKALVNAVEERARAENFNTIIVSGAPDYFEQLGYEKAEIYDIYSDESTLEQLQVKFYGIN